MALIDTDKNGLRAGSHRQLGSAEVLLGSSLLEQHPPALIETPLQGHARQRAHKAQKMILSSPGSHRQPLQGGARFRESPLKFFLLLYHFI